MRRILAAVVLIGSMLMAPSGAVALGGTRQCDFDNDGYDDAAIGVSGEAVGVHENAGAVNVIYGSQDKLTSIGDQIWTQNSPGIDDAAAAGDSFGRAIACGDFNNDTFADLVIGVPFEDVGGIVDAGAAHLLFGSATGLSATDSLFLHRDIPGVAGRAVTGDRFGWSLAAGDFDGDGDDDLAVGVALDDIGVVLGGGSVHVFHGFSGGLSTSGDKIWHRASSGIKGVPSSFAQFGFSLATGDFDGSGHDDLAIGARGDTVNSLNAAGAVNVIYGSSSGLTRAGDDLFHRATPGVRAAPAANDNFGHVLAAGDFDNNGFDELAIGVPYDDVGDAPNAGSVHVLQGSAGGLKTGGDVIWHRAKAGVRGAASANDRFGFSLASGRFNAGVRDDLAIGVGNDTIGKMAGTGSVHVLYGGTRGLSAAGDQMWHQNQKGINGTNEAGDRFGWSVSAGDFNGDSRYDLLVSVPYETMGAAFEAGRVGVIYGTADGLRAAGDQTWSQDSAGIQGVAETGDSFGRNVGGASN